MKPLADLLNGRLPLARALWRWALLYGTLINLAGLLAALAAVAAGAPAPLALALFLLPLAYVAVAVVGVWRSAGQDGVPAREASGARVTVLLWAVAMLVV
ncbi:MAG: hypothetical protein WD341_10440 [Tistlia sp.]|uniref:hypothetical protein n=1 Tax=Tistlia sp. TaxID=3057121 RepID=UPI0034A2C815